MTERRRRHHPAAASRILVAGLSTAATLGLTANLSLARAADPAEPLDAATPSPPPATSGPAATPAPPPAKTVVVVRRHYVYEDTSPAVTTVRGSTRSSAGASRSGATGATSPGPAPAPRPVTRSRGS